MEKEKFMLEEAKKRFQQIYEYINMSAPIEEADDTENNPEDGAPADAPMGDAPADGGMDAPMGGAPADGGMGAPMDGAPADGGMGAPMGGAPADGGMGAPMDGAPQGPEGFNPQVDDAQGGDMGMGDESMQQPDDEVIDVSDLTDAQEETEEEVEKLGDKFSEVLGAIKTFETLIKQNDDKIEDLKAEFEKRNPTQIEKLSMQTAKSYPFNISVEDYWKDKEANSNYSTENDDNGKEQGQYVITKDDVNGDVDWKSIANSLDDDDFIYNQTLNGVLNF